MTETATFPQAMTNGRERYMVESIRDSKITEGSFAGMSILRGRRWIKSRKDWAKTTTEFLIWADRWTAE